MCVLFLFSPEALQVILYIHIAPRKVILFVSIFVCLTVCLSVVIIMSKVMKEFS